MSATVGTAAGSGTARPRGAWPSDTFFEDENDIFFNGEAVQVLHQPDAAGDGDSIVFFRRVRRRSWRATCSPRPTYPVFDRAQGGSINGVIAALNRIIRLTVPTHNQEGGTMVVPGHGRLGDEMDVVEYRNMLTIVRDRIQALVAEGKTLEQVRAAQPTLDYDARYGAATRPGIAGRVRGGGVRKPARAAQNRRGRSQRACRRAVRDELRRRLGGADERVRRVRAAAASGPAGAGLRCFLPGASTVPPLRALRTGRVGAGLRCSRVVTRSRAARADALHYRARW